MVGAGGGTERPDSVVDPERVLIPTRREVSVHCSRCEPPAIALALGSGGPRPRVARRNFGLLCPLAAVTTVTREHSERRAFVCLSLVGKMSREDGEAGKVLRGKFLIGAEVFFGGF